MTFSRPLSVSPRQKLDAEAAIHKQWDGDPRAAANLLAFHYPASVWAEMMTTPESSLYVRSTTDLAEAVKIMPGSIKSTWTRTLNGQEAPGRKAAVLRANYAHTSLDAEVGTGAFVVARYHASQRFDLAAPSSIQLLSVMFRPATRCAACGPAAAGSPATLPIPQRSSLCIRQVCEVELSRSAINRSGFKLCAGPSEAEDSCDETAAGAPPSRPTAAAAAAAAAGEAAAARLSHLQATR
jgi:hypothetical protein